MAFPDRFYDHALILAPLVRHQDFLSLREKDPDLDFSLLTLEEAEGMFADQADDRALLALLRRDEGLSYSLAKEILAAITSPYFARNQGQTPTLRLLLDDASFLASSSLLYRIPCPEKTFEGKSVIVSGYQDGFRISSLLGELHNMAISYETEPVAASPVKEVAAFPDLYEELHYVFNLLAKDIESGTPIDDLYLLGADAAYDPLLEEFASLYGFAVEPLAERRLLDTPIYRLFREAYLATDLESALAAMRLVAPQDPNADAIEKMARLLSLARAQGEKTARLYDEAAATLSAYRPPLTHAVHRLEGFTAPKGAHVYLLNFAMGAFPRIHKESGLLLDAEKSLLGLPTSASASEEDLRELLALLASPSLKAIAYAEKGFGRALFPSSLLKRQGMRLVKSPVLPYEYAADKGAFLLASLLDEKEDYLYEDPRLNGLLAAVPLRDFRTYDYRYRPFLPPVKEGKRTYSPTSLERFYGCPFSYYLSSVLKIEERDTPFLARVGTIFHAVMESLYSPSFSFPSAWAKAVADESENGPFSPKEEVLLRRLEDECAAAVDFTERHDKSITAPQVATEGSFALPSKENPDVVFGGRYDKIVTFGEGSQYFAIVDYKTGSERFEEALLPFGLSLQLPFYADEAMQDDAFKGKELLGLFIGPLLPSALVKAEDKTLAEAKDAALRLDGIYAADYDKLLSFDPSARKSSFIRGLAYGEKGFRRYGNGAPRYKTPEDFAALANKASELALAADKRIRQGDFAITPVRYKAAFYACEYCPFRNVCYRPDSAVKELLPRHEDEEEEGNDGQEMDE